MKKERRMRVIYVRPEELLDWFNLAHKAPTQSLVWAHNLPDDCILKDVRYDCKMAVFGFYKHHGVVHRVVVKSELK